MRAIVLLLMLLAGAKVGYNEYLFRTATNDVIISAYRERAIAACQRDAKGQTAVTAGAWAKPQSIKLVIGKGNLDVYFWQVDHALWNARFKNPYLFVTATDKPNRIYCEFDIVHGAASVFRM
ncbi:MAG: hypothetical protein ACKVP7_02470 [Hyphomicrobiaceae bacterium]